MSDGRPPYISRRRPPRPLEAGDPDRPLFWRDLPPAIRALGKRLRWLMSHGDFPKAKTVTAGGSRFWSARAVGRWCDAHQDWLKKEGERWAILDAIPAGEGAL